MIFSDQKNELGLDIENQFGFVDDNISIHLDSPKNQILFQTNLDLINTQVSIQSVNSNKVKKSKSYSFGYDNNDNDNKLNLYEQNSTNKFIENPIQPQLENFFEIEQRQNFSIGLKSGNYDLEQEINSSPKKNLLENKTTYQFTHGCVIKTWNYLNLNKTNWMEIINKMISIFMHVFVMVVFEIYFYFNYIVWIEKESFLNEIDKYLDKLDTIQLSLIQKQLIKTVINMYPNNNAILDYLYDQYIKSLAEQKKLLNKLLIKACMMGGIVGLVLLIFILVGLIDRKKIKWKWILMENLFMFIFLGIFEYFFFMTIIMNYNPITEDEIKYHIANELFSYFNSTNTNGFDNNIL